MEQEEARGRRLIHRHAVDRHAMQRGEQGRGRGDGLAVQRDAAFRDHPLDFAAGRHAGAGEQLGDALRFRLAAGAGGSAGRVRIGGVGSRCPGFAGSRTGRTRAGARATVAGLLSAGARPVARS